ncbi:hypothetical protein HPB50_014452 [Hyalomma asiaticum]|uniref:Uncharacterized protein n=1 Tax=Hyalomma asiaticum TaxID=266040 RepID=A0ACB7T2I6_HYAAI|nr:hypothetical protein HPB50_014452 [Hyalomma asiaticum]
MEEGPFASRDFVVERILDHLDTEELFTCAEVNRLWRSVALSLLRRKLVSVSVCCVQDSERGVPVSALERSHVCADIFCSKFSRFRNIARMAGLRPSLVFITYHADLNEDRRAVERLREFLPQDSVIVYFKLELVRTPLDSEDSIHEGMVGEILFRADEDAPADASAPTRQEADDQPPHPPDLAVPGPSRLPYVPSGERLRPHVRDTQSAQPRDLAAALAGGASSAGAPLPLRPRRPRLSSSAGVERGAFFRNVLPGVLVFQALHVTEANREGNAVTSYFTEEATGRTVQVTSAAVFNAIPNSQLDAYMRRLSDEFGSTCQHHRFGVSPEPGRITRRAGSLRTVFPFGADAGQSGDRVQRGRPIRANEQAEADTAAHQASRLSR